MWPETAEKQLNCNINNAFQASITTFHLTVMLKWYGEGRGGGLYNVGSIYLSASEYWSERYNILQ